MWDGLDVSSPPCVVASATFTGFDVETSTFTNQGMNTPNFYVHNSDDVELGITLTALATTGMVYPLTVTVELDQTLNSPAVTVPASTPHGFLRSVQTWAGYMRTYNSGSANVLLDSTSLLDQSATDTLATAGDTFHVSVEAVGGDVWVDEWLSWKITATDANGAEVVLNTTTTGGMSSANDILVTDTSVGVNVHMTQ